MALNGLSDPLRKSDGYTQSGAACAGTPVRSCPELQACIPLSEMQIAQNMGVLSVPGSPSSLVGTVGVCTTAMASGYHLPNATTVPPPM